MKHLKLFILCLLSINTLLGCNTNKELQPGVSIELAEFRKQVVSEIEYTLHLTIPENKDLPITGKNVITFSLSENSRDLALDFREKAENLSAININGSNTDILFENEHVLLPKSLLTTGSNTVSIEFKAGETSLNRNPEYLYTLFVPDRARTAFPLFDQPNLKANYTLSLELPQNWKAVSNAPLEAKTERDSTTLWSFEPSDLISSYLFSFVAGEFETITRTVDGYEMTLLHRETDEDKVERNLEDIFQLHASSIKWLEDYTGIKYPFKKFDFALIPSFQYGGMEHVGAIQYRASSLFLDEAPSESRLLGRASLIAHETAHMWFGDLVTMDWFNDVWTKEVFANFMAAKIVNPSFPNINHDLNFLVRHYPSAYSVDRTTGANPIRQELPNLNKAGTMYGAIIYNKAPIMMRQLELLVGEETFREGLQEYLNTYAFANATWPDLISILDQKTSADLKAWSEVWVNTPGRPTFDIQKGEYISMEVRQIDPEGKNRVWPQTFEFMTDHYEELHTYTTRSRSDLSFVDLRSFPGKLYNNSNGYGYGLFSANIALLEGWKVLDDVAKGSLLINIYENMLEGTLDASEYLDRLIEIIPEEENQLLLNLALGHLRTIYWNVFDDEERLARSEELEQLMWQTMLAQQESSRKKIFFNTYRSIVLTASGIDNLYSVWSKELDVNGLILSENDYISMAGVLAIKSPDKADDIISEQLSQIKNSDRKRRFEFIAPSLSNDSETRDSFFESLALEENRQTESWVLSALGNLHHPLRTSDSEKYILPSLELLEQIQVTGDIFFPGRWTGVTLGNYNSDTAVETVRDFLATRPNYNNQLRMKILQSADMLFRVNEIRK
ncbi:MAG: M1 family aminopeptidase [Balneolaceae bacterium]